ncbi:MAG: InlB B-repeat-containing protein [Clostridia bacterium]|nr:InlB B-repeat-containing protein [Clostridia bacterium]
MKRKSTKRIATVCLSLFLACICLATVFAFPIKASAAGNNYGSININNSTSINTTIGITNTNTTIQIININNNLLKEAKKENAVLRYVKDNGRDWVSESMSIIKAVKDSNGDVDGWKMTNDVLKKFLNSLPGAWALLGTAFEGIESLLSSGEAPLSEVQVLSDDMEQQFNAMGEQLDDIEAQLGSLSNQVTSSVNEVLSGTQTQINNLEAKEILRSFMSSGEGNFSYLEYSNHLYGSESSNVSASEAYYILYLEATQAGDEELINYYFDKLFENLYHDIAIYNQYYYGDLVGLDKSMAAYYYDYLSYNPDLVKEGSTAEYEALMFALDLYSTYVYSYEILDMCFGHQVTEMYCDASLENRDILDTDVYWFTKDDAISYSTIKKELIAMQNNLSAAEEQVAKDIAYILGMEDSYIAVDENGDIHNIGNSNNSFGNIANGQDLYLNIFPDEVCELFCLNPNKIQYYVAGTEYTGANRGIVTSDDINKIADDVFTVSVRLGSTELYSIDFSKIDAINNSEQKTPLMQFSGGNGTAENPYLISNEAQLLLANNNLNASYRLISNIDITGVFSPIGTEKNPFNGTFDGNGYTITNLTIESVPYTGENITMTPTTGMFGTIGRNGVVKNINLRALQVTSDYHKDSITPENDTSYFCIGGIAGTNKGIISNCSISGDSVITVGRTKQVQHSRSVEVYVGGITGNNYGTIQYCTSDSLTIDATSYLYYYNESINENRHGLYVGGITAIANSTVQNCRVSENTIISAYAKSIANSSDDEKPFLTVNVGGIAANESAVDYISNVFSNCTIAKCKGEIYNEGTYWGAHRYSWTNVSLKQGQYYPTFFPLSDEEIVDDFEIQFYMTEVLKLYNQGYTLETAKKMQKSSLIDKQESADAASLIALGKNAIDNYNNELLVLTKETNKINAVVIKNTCDINSIYLMPYLNQDYVYKNGTPVEATEEDNGIPNITFVDENGDVVEATIVSHYSFYTYHESENAQLITVKLFFYVDGVLMSDDITLSINGKELIDKKVERFVSEFEKNSSLEFCLNEIFEGDGFDLVYIYSNGQKVRFPINSSNKASIVINGLSTSDYGEKTITITHNGNEFEQIINIVCYHDFEYENTVAATCQTLGYEVWGCTKDGCNKKAHRNYFEGDHEYYISEGIKATCHEAGYTHEVSCSVCGEKFENREWIQALPHDYRSYSQAGYVSNANYPSDEYHYCINGNHYEPHQFVVSETVNNEGNLLYNYTCSVCHYVGTKNDNNIITDEESKLPTLLITDGYVLRVGEEVVVYVQILNNPKFDGANFGIRYTEGLELISVEESSIIPQQLQTSNPVYYGYNFLWAEGDGNVTTEDGYLLKLTFKYVSEELKNQTISIVYSGDKDADGNFNGGFSTLDDRYGVQQFMTKNGTIRVVDHLPGDVDSDEDVDLMDATYIAWSLVGKKDEQGNFIQVNARYADVNLDGNVNIKDVVCILQSLSGRYGTNLLSPDYEVFFNFNHSEFVCDDIEGSVMVKFYDENGNRTTWSENIDFEKYKAVMNQLGYTFVGWYTRMACTCEALECSHFVKASATVKYDNYQAKQTLYARWEKNKIEFNMGGSDCEQFDDILYNKSEHENQTIVLETPTWSYDVTYIVDGEDYDHGKIYKQFNGWINADGEPVAQIDLSIANQGTIVLTATWSEYYYWPTPEEQRPGYQDITQWYTEFYSNSSSAPITTIDDDVIEVLKDNGLKIYGKSNPISYTITYANTKGMTNTQNPTVFTTEKEETFVNLSNPNGYIFSGWVDSNGNKITSTKGILGNITLTATWTPCEYVIHFNANGGTCSTSQKSVKFESAFGTLPNATATVRTGYKFVGWFTASSGGSQVTSETILSSASNCTIYAHWEANSYKVTLNFSSNQLQSTPQISSSSKTITFDSTTAINTVPTATGYAFAGWKTSGGVLLTDATGNICVSSAAGYISNGKWCLTSDTTLYASWVRTTPNSEVVTSTFTTSVYAEGTYIGKATFSVTGVKVKYNNTYYIYGNAYYSGVLGTTRFNDVDNIYFKDSSQSILMGGVLHWRSSSSDNNESGVAGWNKSYGCNVKNICYRVEDPGKDFAANSETITMSLTDICVAIGGTANSLDGVPEVVTSTLTTDIYCEDKYNSRVTLDLMGIKVQYNGSYYLYGNAFYKGNPNGSRFNDVNAISFKSADKYILLGGTIYWSGSVNDNNESGIAGYNKNYGFNEKSIEYMVEDPGKDFSGGEENIISIAGICVQISGGASGDTITPTIKSTTFTTPIKCESTTAMSNITFTVVGFEANNNGIKVIYGNAFYTGDPNGSRFNDVATLYLSSTSKKVYLGGTIHWFGSRSDNNESGVAGYYKGNSSTNNVSYLQEDPGKDFTGDESTEISITGICVAMN